MIRSIYAAVSNLQQRLDTYAIELTKGGKDSLINRITLLQSSSREDNIINMYFYHFVH